MSDYYLVFNGTISALISGIEDLIWQKENSIAEYRKKIPAEDNELYICETIAAKFVYDHFEKRKTLTKQGECMTPRQQLDNIVATLEIFKQNCVNVVNCTIYRVKEGLKVKNIDQVIESISKKIEGLCELQLREILVEDGSIPNPKDIEIDKIIDLMVGKIQGLLKLQFEDILKSQKEVGDE